MHAGLQVHAQELDEDAMASIERPGSVGFGIDIDLPPTILSWA
jgi:hypothetical protein